ncbi:MAG: acyltransferase [Anaerostipes sp.]|nr:acyltransferase [Anaerostipes sp.]
MKDITICGRQRHYEVIDYLKAFSITTIVLYHLIFSYCRALPEIIIKTSFVGGAGVHIFIFVSGFGLFCSYMYKPLNYVKFIKVRFLKIYIPYIVIVAISACVPFTYTGESRGIAFLSHLFLFKMFDERYLNSFGGHFWYMSTLFQLYLMFIPIYRIQKKITRNRFIISAFLISIFYWTITAMLGINGNLCVGYFALQYLWEFCLGMAFANYLSDENIKVSLKLKYLIPIIIFGLLFLGISGFKGGWIKVYNDLSAFLGYGSLSLFIYGMMHKYHFFNVCWKFLSKVSYEWYLTHILVFSVWFHVWNPRTIITQLICGMFALLCSVIMAYVYHLFINSFVKKH